MIKCTNFRPYESGYCKGFADISVDKWGITLKDLTLFEKDGKRWVALPSKEYTDKETGEKKRASFIHFKEKEHKFEFCKRARDAIDQYIGGQRD